jgi:hypothetical protein
MANRPTHEEIAQRIREVAEFHGGVMAAQHALVWEGYLAALLEWQLISADDHARLQSLLPDTPAAPALTVFIGPEGAREVMQREGLKD